MKSPVLFALVGLGLLMMSSKALPRGFRNNNPGNIRPEKPNRYTWEGETGESGGYLVFASMPYGVRAAYINLRSYFGKGYNTIEKIITRWAPANENHTENYIRFVENRTGISRHTPLHFSTGTARALLDAIFYFENGREVSSSDFEAGLQLVA